MLLSVIIVNYKVRYFLEQCLYSVANALTTMDAEIIVVDNNSNDGCVNYLQPKFPKVVFIENKLNTGYAKANNQALEQALGDYILFLNPDTLLPADCLEKCVRFLQSKTEVGALGIHMIDGLGNFLKESKRGFPSPITAFFKLCGFAKLFPKSKIFARYYLGHLNENENHEVDVLAGAFMLVRKKTLDQTGSFDESFFMYGEDIDLSYRIQKMGWKNYYFSESTIIHFKGESTKKGSLNYIRLFYGAMVLFAKKHYQTKAGNVFILLIQLAIAIRALLSLIFQPITKLLNAVFNASAFEKNSPDFYLLGSAPSLASAKEIIDNYETKINTVKVFAMDDKTELTNFEPKSILVFCTDDCNFTLKKTIELMTTFSRKYRYQFHHKDSGSIINSYSKNNSGEVLIKK